MKENEYLELPWSVEDTIENLEAIKEIMIEKVRAVNLDGKAKSDVEEIEFDFGRALSALRGIQQYRAIGTVDECREARERQRVKKYRVIKPCKSVTYYQCPFCDRLLHINENFCGECGQAIDWGDAD